MRSAAAEAASGRSTDSDLVKDALRLAPSRQRSGSWTLVLSSTERLTSPRALAQHYTGASSSCEELVTPPRAVSATRRGFAGAGAEEHLVSLKSIVSAVPPKLPSPVDGSPTSLFSPEQLSKTLERATKPAPFAFRAVAGVAQEPPSPSSAAPSRLLSWIHH